MNVAAKGLRVVAGFLGTPGSAVFAGVRDTPPEIAGPAGQVGCDVSGVGAEVDIEVAENGAEVLAPVPNTFEEPAPNADLEAVPPKADGGAGVAGPNVVPPKALDLVARLLNADGALADDAKADPEGPKAEPNDLGVCFDPSPANADVPEAGAAGVGTAAKLLRGGRAVEVWGCPPKLLVSHSVALFTTGWPRGVA